MSLDDATDLVKQQTLTRDAFLGGRLTVSQPAKGFRAGLDSVLLGAAVNPRSRSLLDLGAGVGTASLVALCDLPQLTGTLVEADAAMAALAALNLRANGFAERAKAVVLDLTSPGRARAEAGLPSDHFTTVIANPPFFDPSRGSAPTAARSGARHMDDQTLDRWVKTAATHCAPAGEVIFIHIAEALPVLLPAFVARFGEVRVLPLLPREGEPASRILVRGIKSSRAPFSLLAARALHAEGRAFRPDFDGIFRGTSRLVW